MSMDRRGFLKGGSIAGAVGLSGCLELFEVEPDEATTPSPEEDETPGVELREPEFELTDMHIGDLEIIEGQPVTVTTVIQNVGNEGGEYAVVLEVGYEAVTTHTIELEPGEEQEVTLESVLDTPGEYPISIDSIELGIVTVLDRVRWSYTTGELVYSSPTVVDNVVYVGSNDQHLYALDAETGGELWRFETGEGVAEWDDFHPEGVKSSPQVVDGTVYFGSNDNSIYAVDAGTGEEQWNFKTNYLVYSSPTTVNGIVYVSSRDDYLYALDSESGDLVWKSSLEGDSGVSPTVADGKVYSGSYGDFIGAFDAESGEEVWRYEAETCSSPTVHDGTMYIGAWEHDPFVGVVYALDGETGDLVWRAEMGKQAPDQSSPTIKDGILYIAAYTGYTHAFNIENGEEIWRAPTRGPGYTSPTAVDDAVFIQGKEGYLYEIDANTGDIRWEYNVIQNHDVVEDPRTFRVSSPIVVDGTLYVGTIDHKVVAVRTNVEGSSNGSRVELGTKNHHDSWNGVA